MKKETIIISLGGSLIIPEEIDVEFLKKFRNLILKYINKKKFFIYVGGGSIARKYQKAAAEFTTQSKKLDWLGILTTRLNSQIVKLLFGNLCYSKIITDPIKKIKTKKNILVYGGGKPGHSTDYPAVLLAKNFKIKKIVNLTNIDYIYNCDPKKFPNAKPLKKINWPKFSKIVGEKWSPGLSMPFDPIAAKIAQKLKIKVIIINGTKLARLECFLNHKPFIGTIITP